MDKFELLLAGAKADEEKRPDIKTETKIKKETQLADVKPEYSVVKPEHPYWSDPKTAPALFFMDDILKTAAKTEEIELLRKEMLDLIPNPLGSKNLNDDIFLDLKYLARGRLLLAVQKSFSEIQSLKGAPVRNEFFETFVKNDSLRPRFLELCARYFAFLKMDDKGVPFATIAFRKRLIDQSLGWFQRIVPYLKTKDGYRRMNEDETTEKDIYWNLPTS